MTYLDNVDDIIKNLYFLKTADDRVIHDYEISKRVDTNYKRAINLLGEIELLKEKYYRENKED